MCIRGAYPIPNCPGSEPMTDYRPENSGELAAIVAAAFGDGETLAVTGGGSKSALGRPIETASTLDLGAFSEVIAYEPSELVLTVGAATPLARIEALLAEHNQMLAFEPPDWRRLLGSEDKSQTLGGILSTNLSGSRRPNAGAARDHFLGFKAVNGRGEEFKAGGRVVKNVTGYDLCKLMAGAYGTLGVLTEVTVKVLPAPETVRTLLLQGAEPGVLTTALATPHEVSGATWLPSDKVAALRIEGFGPSVAYRSRKLLELCRLECLELDEADSISFWRGIGDADSLQTFPALWRLSVPPARGAAILEALTGRLSGKGYLDWGGGLIWLGLPEERPEDAAVIRGAFQDCGGHATLVRGNAWLRAAIPVFEPLPPPLAALSARVKASFDPGQILNPGRIG